MEKNQELVSLTIDGVKIQVPKGTNLIEAAKIAGVDVPYYCYHPDLSIAGNCRMCQVQVEGQPKLTIGCNTGAAEGMVVRTQKSSPAVAEAQRATLEFLLINHPLDCTVCDQAGHCKLQDYYYQYNTQASRFVDDKVHKVKAESLGPEIVYDGERCIVCTRCVRFCDEITETSELGVFNRGDNSVIGIHGDKELDNPLSGTVVDLCPVGALTHKRWRFNTRIWYTSQHDSICPGCSTGCNVKVAVRDDKIVHVKARQNAEVNKEWLCDEGRYGFDRFQPAERITSPMIRTGDDWGAIRWDQLRPAVSMLRGTAADTVVLISPFLTVEETWASAQFIERVLKLKPSEVAAVQISRRELSAVEQVLISPDYAPNARGAELVGLGTYGAASWREEREKNYRRVLETIRSGRAKRIMLIGDMAVAPGDLDKVLQQRLHDAEVSLAITPRGISEAGAQQFCTVVLPGRTVNEKSGLFVNRDLRIQRIAGVLTAPFGAISDWMVLSRLAQLESVNLFPESIVDERSLSRHILKTIGKLQGLTLTSIGVNGVALEGRTEAAAAGESAGAIA